MDNVQLLDLQALYNLLIRFNIGELKTLCFQLGIDYEVLEGEGKANKATGWQVLSITRFCED